MRPDVLVHFADRIAQIGVYEGLWWFGGDPKRDEPNGLRVRLDDGTPAVVIGECATGTRAIRPQSPWLDGDTLVIHAVHDHRTDTLRWRDAKRTHTELCALARA